MFTYSFITLINKLFALITGLLFNYVYRKNEVHSNNDFLFLVANITFFLNILAILVAHSGYADNLVLYINIFHLISGIFFIWVLFKHYNP